ncbi:helix-turn-helix domain-containing protein [Aestuariibius sp. 2305UL40-4]|uniref:helix-turn-helix domain-containing protein n=1 Tax=Aestuariibius violaceus TaxID=3234132 RepID=UPI00345E8C26
MTRLLNLSFDGPPISQVPELDHEFRQAGVRAIALPPGKAEVHYCTEVHIADFNLNEVPMSWSVNSDRLETFMAPSDSVGWSPAKTDLRLRAKNFDWGLLLEMDPTRVEGIFADALHNHGPPTEFASYRKSPRGAILARQLIDHLRFEDPDRLFIEGMSIALWACAWQIHRPDQDRNGTTHASIDPRITRAVDYIEAHLGNDLSVAGIAAAAAMSPSWFQTAFRSVMGLPVFAYVRERRLDRARTLLADRRLSIAQIAYACGFASHSHMTRLFTARYGASPRDMR